MSLIHYTLVGHFDPRTVSARNLTVARAIDKVRLIRLLAEYPATVAAWVTIRDGYARCQWAPAGAVSRQVFEFAYRLAREEGCLAVENGRQVMYPPEAARAQGEVLEQLTGQAGFADEFERRAREQAAELERRHTKQGAPAARPGD
jgi:hypothetical protein